MQINASFDILFSCLFFLSKAACPCQSMQVLTFKLAFNMPFAAGGHMVQDR